MITNSTVKSNVPEIKEFFTKLRITTAKFNKDFQEKEDFFKKKSNNVLTIDTKIEVTQSQTTLEIKRVVKNKENKIVENTQKFVATSPSPEIISQEVEYPLHMNLGLGYIKYNDGTSYFGIINSDEKMPSFLGIFSDSEGKEVVKLEHGLEYGLSAWMPSVENLPEILNFLKEYVEKGYLSSIDYNLFIELTVKTDLEDLDNEISRINAAYLKDLAFKTTENNKLLNSFIISLAKYSHKSDELLFNLTNKDGSVTPFYNISLKQLLELATVVTTHYDKTNEVIYDFEIVAKELKATYYPSACEALFKKLNLPQTSKLYVNRLDKLATADFYIKMDDSLELKKIDIHLEFSILSSSGRTGYTFNDKNGFFEIYNQAQRWTGYSLHIDLQNNSSIFIVSEPHIYSDVYEAAEKIFG